MRKKVTLILAMAALFVAVGACWGQTTIDDPLHGCIIGTSCTDNGTVTPTTTNPLPNFTFTISPGPNTGDFLVDILVPNDVPGAGTESYSISATNAGPINTSTIAATGATLKGNWTTGGLGAFLGLTLGGGSPNNNITAWLPYVQSHGDPGATGFYVYQVDLGNNQLQGPANPTVPVLTLSGSSLPLASLLAGFLGNGTTFGNSTEFISTANSGAIFEADGPPAGAPEPSSVLLLGTFVAGALVLKKKLHKEA
jgi:hypothetical protein